MLILRGVFNILSVSQHAWSWIGGAIIIGALKGQFIFVRNAKKNIKRIIQRGDGKCLGGFISWKNWLLVISMILMGKILRLSSLPEVLIWDVYVAVGFALLISSRVFWSSWLSHPRKNK